MAMSTLTIQEAAETTGWSPRMLRYIEQVGLVAAPRSAGGYRLYGPAELQRLRTLRELLQQFDIGLTDVGFALRLRRDEELRAALDEWFQARPAPPADVPADDWLRWEYDKHQKLLAEIPVAQRSRPAPVDAPTGAYPIVDIPDDTGTYPVVDIADDDVRSRSGRRPGAHRNHEENR
ncbi:MerR HTH family regulatory protein [Cryptosporangium aurantiacum]|uniref:MerR HTH family regulatory protein n=2 Tax=Cryptosporangium aurantiacum TaxID=134849 RepID=A0A1M7QUY2_9ACTN|nr:MerR HTH family regulatory protein [Cryptosporangium aurantiacum]